MRVDPTPALLHIPRNNPPTFYRHLDANNKCILRMSISHALYNCEINVRIRRSLRMRQYLRSKTPRLRWTAELHQSFLHAIRRLGDENKATPKLIMEIMGIDELKTSHVKSHLQMYRNMKKCEKCPVHKQENHNLDRFENSRGNKDGHSPFSELEQKSEINKDFYLYSNKRNSITTPSTSSQYENGQSTSSNNIFFETRLDTKKFYKNPKLNPAEYRTQHLVHIKHRQLQYSQRKKEKHQFKLSEQELENSLYHQHRVLCSSGTSNQKRRPISEQDQISCNSSIDSDSVLILNGTRCDNDGRAESTEGDGVEFVEKRILREEDIRLELSISIC